MKILFLCTHNACRSILAEAVTNQLSNGKILAASAGSHPAGDVHPLTLKHLASHGYKTEGLSSKSWETVERFSPDIVITVCDQSAGETCPVWFGKAIKAHWAFPDPTKMEGSDSDITVAFDSMIHTLESRIKAILSFGTERYDRQTVQTLLTRLATMT